jgi:hypothetical protein
MWKQELKQIPHTKLRAVITTLIDTQLPILLFTGFLPAHLDSILGEQER